MTTVQGQGSDRVAEVAQGNPEDELSLLLTLDQVTGNGAPPVFFGWALCSSPEAGLVLSSAH